jgi:hypothetical protein
LVFLARHYPLWLKANKTCSPQHHHLDPKPHTKYRASTDDYGHDGALIMATAGRPSWDNRPFHGLKNVLRHKRPADTDLSVSHMFTTCRSHH